MKVLLIGGGGREHALAWKIAQSPELGELVALPGNPGIAAMPRCRCVAGAAEDAKLVVELARTMGADLAVVGPEAPLVAGIAEKLAGAGVACFGPGAAAARLEGSKSFAKEIMASCGVPTAAFAVFDEAVRAHAYVEQRGAPIVVKADGLAAGKGAMVCGSVPEAHDAVQRMLEKRELGAAGRRIVIEECLAGEEASFLAIVDEEQVIPLASSQDHKRVGDGDTGPNTGGMGAYSAVPVLGRELETWAISHIVTPVVRELARRGLCYRGVVYAGLMIGAGMPRVLEFNVRFGLGSVAPLTWREEAAACVVAAAAGYPGAYAKGTPICGLEHVPAGELLQVFQAGTAQREGRLVTAGGRVLGVTALGGSLRGALDRAYGALRLVRFAGMQYRRDIGHRALAREEECR
ncbi:MAG: phosphoribosylamine--glycine ligase [Candidatus Schekmanbacteria bacterium]|nr:phosphoribosylamine--glycine ligase [Candidatus Schekmanbacteria bacterium]